MISIWDDDYDAYDAAYDRRRDEAFDEGALCSQCGGTDDVCTCSEDETSEEETDGN